MKTTRFASVVIALAMAIVFAITPSGNAHADTWLGMDKRVYPNPFTEGTTFQLTMPTAGVIRISVYNMLGRHMRTLYEGMHPAGLYPVPWDGKDEAGTPVPQGAYVCVLFSNDTPVKSVKVIKMLK